MTHTAINYAMVLYELGLPGPVVEAAQGALQAVPQIKQVLTSPVVAGSKKHRIIERIFPKEIQNFLKVLCDHQRAAYIDEVFTAYHEYTCKQKGILIATMYYVTEPGEGQLKKIKELLCEKYQSNDVELNLVKDPGLIGGFIIRTGNLETDWSMRGRLKQLEQKLIRR